jgi:hypothetical protein
MIVEILNKKFGWAKMSDDLDKRQKEKANEIITKMHDQGKSNSDIAAQKRPINTS